jgi:hypothetical protein
MSRLRYLSDQAQRLVGRLQIDTQRSDENMSASRIQFLRPTLSASSVERSKPTGAPANPSVAALTSKNHEFRSLLVALANSVTFRWPEP